MTMKHDAKTVFFSCTLTDTEIIRYKTETVNFFLDHPESQHPQLNPQNPSLLNDFVGSAFYGILVDRIKQIQRSATVRDFQSICSHTLSLQIVAILECGVIYADISRNSHSLSPLCRCHLQYNRHIQPVTLCDTIPVLFQLTVTLIHDLLFLPISTIESRVS